MPAERVAMRQAREIIRLKFSAGLPTREIARRLGVAASTVRGTLRRFGGGGLGWPLPNGMSDGDLEAALYANHGTNRGHRRHIRRIRQKCSVRSWTHGRIVSRAGVCRTCGSLVPHMASAPILAQAPVQGSVNLIS